MATSGEELIPSPASYGSFQSSFIGLGQNAMNNTPPYGSVLLPTYATREWY